MIKADSIEAKLVEIGTNYIRRKLYMRHHRAIERRILNAVRMNLGIASASELQDAINKAQDVPFDITSEDIAREALR